MQDQRNYPKPNLESGANPAQLPGDVKAKLRPARDTGDVGGIGNLSPQKPEGASDGPTSTKAKAPERPGSQRPIPKPRQARQA